MPVTTELRTAPAGIVYSATGEQHVNEALVGARSSLRHNDVPHVLFASPVPEDEVPPGLTVVPFEPEPSGDWFLDAIANMRRSPFERTIFLDTDTYVVGEIVHMLRVLDQYDIAAAHEVGHRPFHDPEVPPIFHEFNTGVIAWRAGELTTMFLDSWHETRREWTRAEPFRHAATDDQRPFRHCAWKHGLRLYVLAAEYNWRTVWPDTVVERIRVIHGRYHDYEGLAAQVNKDRGPRTFVPTARPGAQVGSRRLGRPAEAVPGIVQVWPAGALDVPNQRLPGPNGRPEGEVDRRAALDGAGATSASTGSPSSPRRSRRGSRFRLTIVLPDQKQSAAGIYAMLHYARMLRQAMQVHLAVQDTTPTPWRYTTAGWALEPDDLPDADGLLIPADTPDAWLLGAPERAGRRILYVQGFGARRDYHTVRNLERFGDRCTPTVVNAAATPNVIAVARWLAEEAAQCGCQVAHVPYGLDRAVFQPGPSTGDRLAVVAMMTDKAEWKGTGDGVEALSLVREKRPDIEVVLFGDARVDFACEFHRAPDRRAVAALLRRACVYVVPSWEEGFGMTGVEALACGAALATTDTKGSRDFAEDGHTALVSRPRDTEALAENILRLLDDSELRSSLLTQATSVLAERVPTWEASAARFADAVVGATAERD